jgi:hypothetical protein
MKDTKIVALIYISICINTNIYRRISIMSSANSIFQKMSRNILDSKLGRESNVSTRIKVPYFLP